MHLRLWVLTLLLAVLTVHCMRRCRSPLIPDRILLLNSLYWLGLFSRDSEIVRTSIWSCRLLEPRVVCYIFLRLALILTLLTSWTHMNHLYSLADVEIWLDHHAVDFDLWRILSVECFYIIRAIFAAMSANSLFGFFVLTWTYITTRQWFVNEKHNWGEKRWCQKV